MGKHYKSTFALLYIQFVRVQQSYHCYKKNPPGYSMAYDFNLCNCSLIVLTIQNKIQRSLPL